MYVFLVVYVMLGMNYVNVINLQVEVDGVFLLVIHLEKRVGVFMILKVAGISFLEML